MTTQEAFVQVTRSVVDSPAAVRTYLENAARRGRLVSAAPAQRIAPGQVRVDVVVWEPAPAARTAVRPAERPAQRRTRSRRYAGPALAVTAALAALAALGAVLALALQWVAAHAAVIVGCAVVLVALALMLRRKTGVCMGLHCPGCGHQ